MELFTTNGKATGVGKPRAMPCGCDERCSWCIMVGNQSWQFSRFHLNFIQLLGFEQISMLKEWLAHLCRIT